MEKLIELLNEWSKTAIKNKCNWTDVYDEEGVYFLNLFDRDMTMEMEDVISKRNGFIKWLVDNDKIDLNKVKDKTIVKEVYEDYNSDLGMSADFYSIYESLLMLLAIQDEPIRFLYSILK